MQAENDAQAVCENACESVPALIDELDRLEHALSDAMGLTEGLQIACDALRTERNAARAIARVLAHAYSTGNAPPQRMVGDALGFDVDQRVEKS